MDVGPRPRFEKFSSLELEQVRTRLRQGIKESDGGLTGEVLDNFAQIMIGGSRQHTWSPCMSLSFVLLEEEGLKENLRIRGLFGPRPALWTMVATLYAFSTFIMFIGVVVGWSQWSLGYSPWGFYGILLGSIFVVILYLISISGRTLAHDEMHELAELLDQALGKSSKQEESSTIRSDDP